ncbi:MAG: hypothetical protein ACRDQW_09035, partial [Haloechinothrix sp.]
MVRDGYGYGYLIFLRRESRTSRSHRIIAPTRVTVGSSIGTRLSAEFLLEVFKLADDGHHVGAGQVEPA